MKRAISLPPPQTTAKDAAAFAADSFKDTGRRPASEARRDWAKNGTYGEVQENMNLAQASLRSMLAENERKHLTMTAMESMAADNRALGRMLATPTPFIGYTPAEIEPVIAQLRVLRETIIPDEEYSRGALYVAAAMLACYRDDQARAYQHEEDRKLGQMLREKSRRSYESGVEDEKKRQKGGKQA